MCRLYGLLANEETKVECSLVHAQNALMLQSRSDLRGKSHSDGWGIGFYHNSKPELERRATPAFEDIHFSTTAERIFSHAVVAHVRKGTIGGPLPANTHPFSYGHWTFAHNGTATAFDRLGDRMIQETDPTLQCLRRGETDSEQIFYWLLSRLSQAGISLDECCPNLELLAQVVAESIDTLAQRSHEAGAEKPAKLNFLMTDGVIMLASRWKNSLFHVLREGIHDCEICGIPHVHHQSGVEYRAVAIASEPISHEEWQEIPDRHILAVDQDIKPKLIPIESNVP